MEVKVGSVKAYLHIEDLGTMWKLSTTNPVVRQHVIKSMEDRKWHGGRPPAWDRENMYYTCPKSSRNIFNLDFYRADTPDPYLPYRVDLIPFGLEPRYHKGLREVVPPFPHQVAMADHWWTRKRCHIAAEMRTGKTLPALSIVERLQLHTWFVAPRSAIAGVKTEIHEWGFDIPIEFMTYQELVKYMEIGGATPPEVVIFDECSKIKNWAAQRTQAAFHLTEAMRKEYENPYIMAMSGTPAPKTPVDMWSQVEVVCPGYIKEPNPKELEARLSLIEYRDSETGGQYPHRICWFDREGLCKKCGTPQEEHTAYGHTFNKSQDNPYLCALCNMDEASHYLTDHMYEPCKNEVELFSKRLKGISVRFLLDECVALPAPIIEVKQLPIDPVVQKYAKVIKTSGNQPVVILNDLMQLSAGFYYKMMAHQTETIVCSLCEGELVDPEGITCTRCNGSGISPRMIRKAVEVPCPKDDLLKELLEECEESGRMVVFASFQGAVDRIKRICEEQEWKTIIVDGRGWISEFGSDVNALKEFNANILDRTCDKIVFIANPGSGGMGFSLAAASTIMYWSLSFNNEDLLQSIKRCTTLVMKKGCRVVFAEQLSCDRLVREANEKKTNLQTITLKELD